ncbi:MAG: HD domain-containing protein [Desulfovibrionaceae bacterium]|nr:HD domain-containing protein [Desulfovibrionaceae bacterium]
MRQKNYVFNNLSSAVDALIPIREMLKDVPPSKVLMHIYVSGMSKNLAKRLLQDISGVLPDIPRIGISEFPSQPKTDRHRIKLNLIIADTSFFYSYYIPCTRGTERIAAKNFIDKVSSLKNIKAFEICSANQLTDTSEFIEALSEEYGDISIFGSLSKPARFEGSTLVKLEDSFAIGENIEDSGYSIIVYTGENLKISVNYVQSWRPIGREMCVCLEKKPILGATGLYQIDGVNALEVFLKYLGVPWDDNFLLNAWYFPLIVNKNGINICYTPIGCHEGTIYYGGKINPNDQVQFAYCTREEILEASFDNCQRILSMSPEALMLIICANRNAFMRDEEVSELEYYSNCVSDFTYCHAYGEIACNNRTGGTLNSALVSVALREDTKQKQSDAPFNYSIPKVKKFKNTNIPLSFIVSHFFDQMTHDLLNYQNNLKSEVERISKKNESLSLHIVETLASTIDAKDTYTKGHSSRVAQYSKDIARVYGYSKKKLDEIYMVALLHDVGKIGVPDYVINKKTKLSDDEYAVIREHTIIGANILNTIKEMPNLAIGARWHHERYDGLGYPDGLKGDEIPEIARIIAVADAYDAMTSNRSYRNILPQDIVRQEIKKGKDRQFDPVFADIMLKMIDSDKTYRMREMYCVC